MRSLLLSLPYRKVVSNLLPNGIIVPSKGQRCDCLLISYDLSFSFFFFFCKQIFTNANKVHAVKVLNKLGLEDCFEGIICFETLNPIHKSTVSDDEDDIEFVGLSTTATSTNANTISSSKIFDIIGHFAQPNPSLALPKTPIVCKPSVDAIERALKIANINPQRTVRLSSSFRILVSSFNFVC